MLEKPLTIIINSHYPIIALPNYSMNRKKTVNSHNSIIALPNYSMNRRKTVG